MFRDRYKYLAGEKPDYNLKLDDYNSKWGFEQIALSKLLRAHIAKMRLAIFGDLRLGPCVCVARATQGSATGPSECCAAQLLSLYIRKNNLEAHGTNSVILTILRKDRRNRAEEHDEGRLLDKTPFSNRTAQVVSER